MKRLYLLMFLVACDTACDTKMSMDPGLRFELTRSEAHIDEAQRISAAGGDPTYPCTAVRQMIAGLSDESVHTVNATVTRGRKVCLEVTLKFARGLVAKLESVAPGRGRERLAAECVDLGKSLTLITALARSDPDGAALEKRRQSLCP